MLNLTPQQWVYLFIVMIVADLLTFGSVVYYFKFVDDVPEVAESAFYTATPLPTPTPRPTWAGPGPTVTPTPTWPPTPLATPAFEDGNLTSKFVPTPRPVSAGDLTLNYEGLVNTIRYITTRRVGKMPVINQLLYPEPFFPAGSNNACGPVALYAAMQGLGANFSYRQLRNIAVRNDFGPEGITVSGLVNTAYILNHQLGQPYWVEQSREYTLANLNRFLNQGAGVIVLVRLKRVDGKYKVTGDLNGSFGHYLVVQSINMFNRKVYIAGSTLGMGAVPLDDFLSSWSSNPPEPKAKKPKFNLNWLTITKITPNSKPKAKSVGWALVLRPKR